MLQMLKRPPEAWMAGVPHGETSDALLSDTDVPDHDPKRKSPENVGGLLMVTPTTRSWNEFSDFIEAWEGLRTAA